MPRSEQIKGGAARLWVYLRDKTALWRRWRHLNDLRTKQLLLGWRNVLPDYPVAEEPSQWKVSLPSWLLDQRNQMTGPADNLDLAAKLLMSGSPGVMLDLEDSVANTWGAITAGHENIKKVLSSELKIGNGTVVWFRPRGLHLSQYINTAAKVDIQIPASLYDLCEIFGDMTLESLPHAPCIMIPKCESTFDGQWWRDAFVAIERAKKWPLGTIKCMALVESMPLPYHLEKFGEVLKNYLVGLALGRWDLMASIIHFTFKRPDWIFPDRNAIPHNVTFFQHHRKQLVQFCHSHGLLAIGGMTALFPSRKDSALNTLALDRLKADKQNEFDCGMDGAWTGHPDQNAIAVKCFRRKNQLKVRPGEEWLRPDLKAFPEREHLPVTIEGTKAALRTSILYRQGVLEGRGASLIDGYMEDLATDRINRLMVGQRLAQKVHSEYDVGSAVEEILDSCDNAPLAKEAAKITLESITNGTFNPR
jgi:malate synthase